MRHWYIFLFLIPSLCFSQNRTYTTTFKDTTLIGGYTFSGSNLIQGTVNLTQGTYTLTPGTVFYIQGKKGIGSNEGVDNVTGGVININNHAILNADSALFTSACDTMWSSMNIDTTSSLILNHTTIENELYGNTKIYGAQDPSVVQIQNTHFKNIYYDGLVLWGYGNRAVNSDNFYVHNRVSCNTAKMQYPANDKGGNYPDGRRQIFETIHGLRLSELDFRQMRISRNQFDSLLFGVWMWNGVAANIDSSYFYVHCGGVAGQANYYNKYNDASGSVGVRVNHSRIMLNTRAYSSYHVSEGADNVGVHLHWAGHMELNYDTIMGTTPNPFVRDRSQAECYGVYMRNGHMSVKNCRIESVTRGIYLLGQNISYGIASGNRLANNINNVYVFGNAPISNVQFRCNRMVKESAVILPNPLHEVKGIYVTSSGWLPNQGDSSNPAGNQFVGIEKPIVHDNGNPATTWNYYASVGDNAGLSSSGLFPFYAIINRLSTMTAPDVCSGSLPAARMASTDDLPITQSPNLNTIQEPEEITVYPNPFTESFTISINSTRVFTTLEILDINGKSVFSRSISSGEERNEFAFSKLPVGMYILKLESDQGFVYKRITKN